MGLLDSLGKIAQIVVGGYGLAESRQGAKEAERVVEKAESRLDKTYKLDMPAKRQIAADLQAVMKGDYSSLAPAFKALDENVEAQLKDEMDAITTAERKSMRLIADTATGAAKLRLLKSLAEGAQDKRARAIEAARRTKVTTREGLKSDLTQYARQTLPNIYSGGAQLSIPSANVQLGLQAMLSNAQNAQAQAKYITDVLNPVKSQPSTVIYTGSAPATAGYVPTTTPRTSLTQTQQSPYSRISEKNLRGVR